MGKKENSGDHRFAAFVRSTITDSPVYKQPQAEVLVVLLIEYRWWT
jgi:hypothetical protein